MSFEFIPLLYDVVCTQQLNSSHNCGTKTLERSVLRREEQIKHQAKVKSTLYAY